MRNNPETRRRYMQRYHAENLESENAKKKERRDTWREWAIEALGGACVRCGFSDIRALQIDHVLGDGHSEDRTHYRLTRMIALGEAEMGRYQCLCANCNWIKRVENGEVGGRG